MTTLVSVPQKAQDLRLAILTKDALPALRVLVSERFQIRDWRFEFAIIGESHSLRIERAGQLEMLEVLACIPLEAAECQVYRAFADLQPFAYQSARYQVAVSFTEALPLWAQTEHTLRYQFPVTQGQIPETRLQWQIEAGRITWQSLHSYPEAGRLLVVVSESVFELGD